MEKWPYPNLLVYVVHPWDGEGCNQTLHRSYLLPISPNLEQSELENLAARVENDASPAPVPSVLKQNYLGWLPQAQQVAPQKVVQINLLPFNVALRPLGPNFL